MKALFTIVALLAGLMAWNASVATSATMTDTASVTGNVFSVGCFDGGAFVWTQTPSVATKKGVSTVSVAVDARYDSNGNCAADSGDSSLRQANITVELRTLAGAVVQSMSGSTGGNGTFSGSFPNSVAAGTYRIYVTALTGSPAWNPSLDQQNPANVTVP